MIITWLIIPKEDPEKREEVGCKTEQGEKLQEFVENANLKELRAEVDELQRIKAAMATIRSERFEDYQKFETIMVQTHHKS